MNTNLKTLSRAALALAIAAAFAPAQAGVYPQCPPGGDPDGTTGKVCKHLAGSDGWMSYGDGTRGYFFGFSDVTGVPNNEVMTRSIFNAKFAAPTLAFKQNQEVWLSLTNAGMTHRPDLFDPHSIHFHGFPQAAPIFDGTPEGSVTVNMGSTITYYYKINDPGTYMYHCHVESTEHMQMGMLGNLYVTPAQDGTPVSMPAAVVDTGALPGAVQPPRTFTQFVYNDAKHRDPVTLADVNLAPADPRIGATGYDVQAALQLGSFDSNFHTQSEVVQPLPFESLRSTHTFINGRNYPDTVDTRTTDFMRTPVDPEDAANTLLPETSQPMPSFVTASAGQRILLRLSNLSVTDYFTVTALGLPFKVVGAGAAIARGPTGLDHSYKTSSVTLGGGEAVDVLVDTTGVLPGTYVLYTTNLNFLSNGSEDRGGIMTHIVIN
jgi:FtsP/CotA-like multicopper oxidase with cupredoxin domain